MSTYAIIAVADGDDLIGIYNTLDAYPHELGNRLLLDVLNAAGNLKICARKWIHDAPKWGWAPYISLTPRESAAGDEPSRWRRADLHQAYADFVYVLDPKVRTLSVWFDAVLCAESAPPNLLLAIDESGQSEPPFFREEYPRPPALQTEESPQAETKEAATHRRQFETVLRARLQDSPELQWLASAPAKGIAKLLDAHLAGLNWRPHQIGEFEAELRERHGQSLSTPRTDCPQSVWMCFEGTGVTRLWQVRLGKHQLFWPALGSGERPETSSVVRADGSHAWLSVDDALGAQLVHALWEAAIRAGNPRWDVEVIDGALFRFRRTVPDNTPYDRDTQMPYSEGLRGDPDADMGDVLGFPEDASRMSTLELLDWLRLHDHLGL